MRARLRKSSFVLFAFSVGIGAILGYVYLHVDLLVKPVSKMKQYFQVPHERYYVRHLLNNNIRQATTQHKNQDPSFILVNEGVYLRKSARILCFVMLKKEQTIIKFPYIPTKVKTWEAIRHTWGDRCSRLLFFTNEPIEDPSLEVFSLEGKDAQSWSAMRKALIKISSLGLQDKYNWFLKVEEDTFVIVENLAYFLSVFDHRAPQYFGHPYSLWGSDYNSGGAGYVLSQAALGKALKLISKGHCEDSYTAEDWNLGK